MKPYNIFISWSGDRSKHIALGLRDWLPAILQTAKPWMSESDIDKGARGIEEIGKALSGIKIGIVCLTPENLDSKWVLFEAGALSKTLDVKTRLCTYLLGGLQPKDVPQPLGIFQATRAIKDDTKQLVKTINTAISEEPLTEGIIETLFEPLWPKLEKIINTMPERKAPVQRSVEDMVAEMLEMMRSEWKNPNRLVRDIVDDKLRERVLIDFFRPSEPVYYGLDLWNEKEPNCPNCSSTNVLHDEGGASRKCVDCGATSPPPIPPPSKRRFRPR